MPVRNRSMRLRYGRVRVRHQPWSINLVLRVFQEIQYSGRRILHFFRWAIGVYFLGQTFEMEYSSLLNLQLAVMSNYGDTFMVLQLFKDCLKYDSSAVKRYAVNLVLQNAQQYVSNQQFLRYLIRAMPKDEHIDERLQMVARIPRIVERHPRADVIVAQFLSAIITEDDERRYQAAKAKFLKFLIVFPTSSYNPNVPHLLSENEKFSILAFLDDHVQLDLDTDDFHTSNDVYCFLAKTVETNNFSEFWRIMVHSENYSYQTVMESVINRAREGSLPVSSAIKFMEYKQSASARNNIFGNTSHQMKMVIESDLIIAILDEASAREFDVFLHALKSKRLINRELFQQITKHYFRDIQLPAFPVFTERVFKALVRQTLLAYHTNTLPDRKNQILKRALTLEPHIELFNEEQLAQYIAMLATLSFPKAECLHRGNLSLFKKLIDRLFVVMPPVTQNEAIVDFNELQSLMYCMYQLFDNCIGLKALLGRLAPEWRPLFLHSADLHVITTGNMEEDGKKMRTIAELSELRHNQHIITNVGTLVVAQFGVMHGKHFDYCPDHLSGLPYLRNSLMSDYFHKKRMLPLTKTQNFTGRIITLPHRDVLFETEQSWEEHVFYIPPNHIISDFEDSDDEQANAQEGGDGEEDESDEEDNEDTSSNGSSSSSESGDSSDEDGDALTEYTVDSTDDSDDDNEEEGEENVGNGEARREFVIQYLLPNNARNHDFVGTINAQAHRGRVEPQVDDDEPQSEYSDNEHEFSDDDSFDESDGEEELENNEQ